MRSNKTLDTDLQYKRSFFVRMVSETKMYNPKIVPNSVDLIEPEASEDGRENKEDQ